MAIQEVNAITRLKNGDTEYLIYPATKAENTLYDNSTSGLTSEDMQAAIDELANMSYTEEEINQKITDAINTNITAALNASY